MVIKVVGLFSGCVLVLLAEQPGGLFVSVSWVNSSDGDQAVAWLSWLPSNAARPFLVCLVLRCAGHLVFSLYLSVPFLLAKIIPINPAVTSACRVAR